MAAVAPAARRRRSIPILSQLRMSVGLQRFMLVLGLVLTAGMLLVAALAPLLAPYKYNQISDADGNFPVRSAPSAEHLLGTTSAGYDVLSRVLWGAQTAVLVIVLAVLASLVIGVALGLIAGYFGGWLDRLLVVIADAVYAFPSLLLAIVMSIMLTGGQSSLFLGVLAAALSITVVFIPQYLRVIRAEVLRVKAEAFVESARVIGTPTTRIMTRHVLRNSTRTLPLIMTLNASEAIMTLAALGFIGFGIEPTSAAEWGYDLQKATSDVTTGIWWTALFPGLAIVAAVLGLTLLGESLNDLSDPRLRGRRAARAGAGMVAATSVPGTVDVEGAGAAELDPLTAQALLDEAEVAEAALGEPDPRTDESEGYR